MRTTIVICLVMAACSAAPPPTGTVTWSLTVNGASAGCDRLGGTGTVWTNVTAVLTSGETAQTSVDRSDCTVGHADWDATTLQTNLDAIGADVADIDHLELDAELDVETASGTTTQYELQRTAPFADRVAVPFDLTEIQLSWQPIPTEQVGGGWYTRAGIFVELSSPSINSAGFGRVTLPVYTKLAMTYYDYQLGSAPLLVALGSAEDVSFVVDLVGYASLSDTGTKLDSQLQTAWVPLSGATVALPLDGKP